MGTDDLHIKRKKESQQSLERKKGKREPYDVVLIVCEGSQTEPNYLKGLRESLWLNAANVTIEACPKANDPINIINFAIEKHKRENYNKIFCVFDREQHMNYDAALNKILSNFNDGIPIFAITSVPCFEYWLLLHFIESTKPYYPTKKSVGEQIKSEIKNHIPNYHESDKDIYEKTSLYLDKAVSRAKKIDKNQEKAGTDNPSTKVYLLVEYLKSIKR